MLAIVGALSNHLIIRNEFTELELFAKANSFMVVSKQETNLQSSFNYVRIYLHMQGQSQQASWSGFGLTTFYLVRPLLAKAWD